MFLLKISISIVKINIDTIYIFEYFRIPKRIISTTESMTSVGVGCGQSCHFSKSQKFVHLPRPIVAFATLLNIRRICLHCIQND